MDPISKLTELFREFPGIGPRQARRFVYYLLSRNGGYHEELARLILEVRKTMRTCERCFRFFTSSTTTLRCTTCANTSRDPSTLMIVSRDVDYEAIEKSHSYHGLYFILGGSVPMLDANPEKYIRIRPLEERIHHELRQGTLKEIILSLNANPEGEHTAHYIEHTLKPILSDTTIKITTLGRGLSTGTELEYSDADTIKNALEGRK